METKPPDAQNYQHTLSWNEFERDARILADNITRSGNFNAKDYFTGIIPVLRGGLVLGVRLSHLLSVPLVLTLEPKRTHKCYLVVDDISDTGNTLGKLKLSFCKKKIISKVATLYRKEGTSEEPDYVVKTVDSWINFPWESK